MIPVTYNDVEYNIPTSWSDVKFSTYIKFMDCEERFDKIHCLTGISQVDLTGLNSEGLGAIMIALSFMEYPPDAYLPIEKRVDIGRDTFGKIEMAKSLLSRVKMPKDALIGILKVYTDIDYSEQPTSEAYPLAAFFLTSYHFFLKNTKD